VADNIRNIRSRERDYPSGIQVDAVVLSLENTDLRTLNDVLRAYGKFDVAAGTFSPFSEFKVKDNGSRDTSSRCSATWTSMIPCRTATRA
jgi:hypothetical protein